MATYVLSGSRAGIGSVVLQDGSGKSFAIPEVGVETDVGGAASSNVVGVQATTSVTAPTAQVVAPPITVNIPSVFATAQDTAPKVEVKGTPVGVQSNSAVAAVTTLIVHTITLNGVVASGQIAALTVSSITTLPTNIPINGVGAITGIGMLSVTKAVIGVAATSGIGTPTANLVANVSGVISDSLVANPAIQIGTSLGLPATGVAALAGIGNNAIEIDQSLPSVFTTSGVGILTAATGYAITMSGVATNAAAGTPQVEVDVRVSGVQTVSAVGAFTFGRVAAITGVSATVGIGVLTPSMLSLSGVQANTGIGILGVQSHNAVVFGVQANTGTGSLLIQVQSPAVTKVTIATSAVVVPQIGQLIPDIMPHTLGVQTNVSVGQPTVAIHQGGLAFTDITIETILSFPDDFNMSLRCSDTSGASWQMPTHHSIGREGEYLTSPQWRRLGMSRRGRVFELYWSCPRPTALQGATITFEESA